MVTYRIYGSGDGVYVVFPSVADAMEAVRNRTFPKLIDLVCILSFLGAVGIIITSNVVLRFVFLLSSFSALIFLIWGQNYLKVISKNLENNRVIHLDEHIIIISNESDFRVFERTPAIVIWIEKAKIKRKVEINHSYS